VAIKYYKRGSQIVKNAFSVSVTIAT